MRSTRAGSGKDGRLRSEATRRLAGRETAPVPPSGEDTEARRLVHELEVQKAELEIQNEELRTSQEDFRELLSKYTDLFDFAPIGYFIVDAAGTVQQANLAGAKLLGTPRSALIGTSLRLCLAEGSRPRLARFVADVLTSDEPAACDLEVLRAGEGSVQALVEGTALVATGTCRIAMTDVTRLRMAEAKVVEQNADLERQVHLRTAELESSLKEMEEFSYSVSHDLRAPVRAINGFASKLQARCGGQLDGEGRRLLEVVRTNSSRMGTLIDELLAFSRLGRQEVRREPVDMRAMVESLVSDLAPDRARVNVLVGEIPGADADPALLRVVLSNLLSNAFKFGAGRPGLTVEVGFREQPGGDAYFVRDDGVGFDPRYSERLFRVFERLHSSAEFEGTGIGLALVKRIVERHGGKTGAEGAVGSGATFWFTLPSAPRLATSGSPRLLASASR